MKNVNLSEWALKHQQMIAFLLLLLTVTGILAYRSLGQKEDPDFTIKTMVVQANWPGSAAQQMADQVTDPMERVLQGVAEIDYMSTYVKPGETQIKINLREAVPPSRVPDVWYQVRKKLADIKHTLPQGVQGPFFNDEFGDTYGNMYALTGDGFNYADLRKMADDARNEFLRVGDVNKVQLVGKQEEKIYVEMSTAKLASLGVDPALIATTLAQANAVAAAGSVQTGAEQVRLTVSGEFDSVEGIRAIGIRAGERTFRLGDIAEVRRGFIEPAVTRMRFNGQPALGLAVSMRKGGDVIRLGQQLDATVARIQASLPVGVQIHSVSDQPRVVEESVHEFKKSLAEAVLIVLAVSFFSLGMRTGLVVALCIPLVLGMTFLTMYLLGIDLQRISLGALIIALGLLVDDAIIAVEMMALKLEQGWDKARAATYAYTATAFPMLTGTLITAAGFLPVGFAKSGTGEYVYSLFQVVGIALILSWVVAVLFTPWIGFKLLKEEPHAHHDEDAVYQRGFYVKFRNIVDFCLRRRGWVIGITLVAFCGSLVLFKTVPQQFFPSSDRPELMVDLWMPEASTFAASEREVRELEHELKGDPDIEAVTSFVGEGAPRFYLPLDAQTPNLNLGEMMVMPVTVVVVLLLLMIQLQDMKKMGLVLLTAPLGLIGVAIVMAAFQIPFGFVAMLGVIALAGMIIRNSVILVVQIDEDVAGGTPLWDAIVESAVRRLRPIVLTALAAILAMVPLTGSVFWGPMAWAIMGGLAVATVLTLIFLPALYAACYGAKRPQAA